jgi:hypothetical protein
LLSNENGFTQGRFGDASEALLCISGRDDLHLSIIDKIDDMDKLK